LYVLLCRSDKDKAKRNIFLSQNNVLNMTVTPTEFSEEH